ncbi:MAG: hypothetical protein HC914_05470 [Chloroflexaceae bacterium]|nr:hypothetical protein [Chloroflexaceae bacterium]
MRVPVIFNALAAGLILFSMFGLNWINISSLDILMSLLGDYLQDTEFYAYLREQAGVLVDEQLGRLSSVSSQIKINGWVLAAFPTMPAFLKVVLYLPLAIALVAVIALFIDIAKSSGALRTQIAIVQIGLSAIALLALFFMGNRIRLFGLDPVVFGLGASLIGISLGIGYYMCLLGIAFNGVAGFITLQSPHNVTTPARRIAPPKRSRYRR